eukprot:1167400-Prorocentrum_minimum.AAC.1
MHSRSKTPCNVIQRDWPRPDAGAGMAWWREQVAQGVRARRGRPPPSSRTTTPGCSSTSRCSSRIPTMRCLRSSRATRRRARSRTLSRRSAKAPSSRTADRTYGSRSASESGGIASSLDHDIRTASKGRWCCVLGCTAWPENQPGHQ